MKRAQQGFTLIELVMVIVILGILAATAIPKFVNLTADAERSTAQGIAGGLSSASAINYATRAARGQVNPNPPYVVTSGAGNGCTAAIAGSLLNNGLPANYGVGYANGAAFADATQMGQTWTCKLTDTTGGGNVDRLDANNAQITFVLHWTN